MLIIDLAFWFWRNWRDLISVVSLVLTVVGFAVTFGTLLRTKTAAEEAKRAAEDASKRVKKDLAQFDTISGITSAMSAIDHLLSLQRRGGLWTEIPEHYTRLRRSLTELKSSNPNLSEAHKRNIQSAISQFASIEEQIEEAIQDGKEPDNPSQINNPVCYL